MFSENFSPTASEKGPTGFITAGDQMLVVADGQIYKDGLPVGSLFEDGYLQSTGDIFGNHDQLELIDDIPDCHFQGIDCNGLEIILPSLPPGPSGTLIYNGHSFTVTNGRVANSEHQYLANITDDGQIYVRNKEGEAGRVKLDPLSLLNFTFQGENSRQEPCQHKFARPLFRPDKSYTDNEIIRYFDRFDSLNSPQKKYVLDTMSLWSTSGLLQVVRKSEGDASLGNVKHGATGVTRIRTGNVTLDKEEFEREINYYRQYGPSMNTIKNAKGDYIGSEAQSGYGS